MRNKNFGEKKFLRVLSGERGAEVPFWFMRQAGRYLPEYRALRVQKNGFLGMVMDPVAASEVTMQPLRRFGMDAAILFSDILVIPLALGQGLEFAQGEGPKLDAVRDPAALKKLTAGKFMDRLDPIYQTVRNVRSALVQEGFSDTALIGFAGSPWTVAAYMVEGGGSKDFHHAKHFAYAHPDDFSRLIDMVVEATIFYLSSQVEAGAEALQLFDSWSGLLDAEQFEKWVIAPTKRIVDEIHVKHPHVPIIGFPRGAGTNYIGYAKEAGIDAIGLDSQIAPSWAAQHLQSLMPVQGNMDPFCLFAGGDAMERAMDDILENLGSGPLVFNLGHGIHKDTPIAHVERMAAKVKGFRR